MAAQSSCWHQVVYNQCVAIPSSQNCETAGLDYFLGEPLFHPNAAGAGRGENKQQVLRLFDAHYGATISDVCL